MGLLSSNFWIVIDYFVSQGLELLFSAGIWSLFHRHNYPVTVVWSWLHCLVVLPMTFRDCKLDAGQVTEKNIGLLKWRNNVKLRWMFEAVKIGRVRNRMPVLIAYFSLLLA